MADRFDKDLNIDIKIMRNYLEVIEQNSFTGASRKLRVGQATISHQIQTLEESLGVTLIKRSSREFTVTEEGYLFRDFCVRMLDEFENLKENINSSSAGGTCVLAASSIPSTYIVPDIISHIIKNHKNYLYRTLVGDTREAIELVKEGSAEIGIVGRELSHPGLDFKKIFSDEIIIIGSGDIPDQVHINDLTEYPFVVRENGSGTRAAFEAGLSKAGFKHSGLRAVYESTNSESVKRAVMAGIGAGYISRIAVKDELLAGSIKHINVKSLKISRNFYFLRKKTRPLSTAAALFEKSLLLLSR